MENTDNRAVPMQNSKLLTTLLDVSNLVSSTMEIRPLLEAILDKLGTIIKYENAKIFAVTDDQVRIIAHRSLIESGQEETFPLPVGIDLLQDKKPVVIGDINSDEEIAVTFRKNMERYMDTVFRGVRCWMGLPMVSKDKVVGVLTMDHHEPGFYKPYHIEFGTAFANQAAIEYENAKLYEDEKKRLQENEQRRLVAESLRDILRSLNSNKGLDEILDFIIYEAARLLHTDYAALFRMDMSEKTLSLQAAYGFPEFLKQNVAISVETSVLGKAFMERRPIVSTDSQAAQMTDLHPILDKHLEWIRNNCCGMMAVPLICKDEVYGGIALYFKKDDRQSEQINSKEKIELAMTFADQAALAIDNTRLRKQAEEMAVAAERNRLARDLHDAVTQTLFSASLIAEVVPRILEKNKEEGLKRIEEIRQLTRGALAEMRTLLFELRPATLVEAPLEELLRQLSEALTGRARIPVELNIRGTVSLPLEAKIAFYRIAQEALNNIAKHSGANKASVEFRSNEDKQLAIVVAGLSVTDDGRGFDPDAVTSEHFGLGIMRERAAAIGAKLNIRSRAGEGTTIELEWVGGKRTQWNIEMRDKSE